jgi:hypothetical protein
MTTETKTLSIQDCDEFTRGYVEAMLFTDFHEHSEGLESKNPDDFSQDMWRQIIADCKDFSTKYAELLARYDYTYRGYSAAACAGHDFWFTRNNHGSGFWDRDIPEELGDALTKASNTYKEISPCLGDDGLVYLG